MASIEVPVTIDVDEIVRRISNLETKRSKRIAELEKLLRDILSSFMEKGHPGYSAVRTHWINVKQVQEWHHTLDRKVEENE